MDMSASQALKFILGTDSVSPFLLGSCSLARWPIAFATGKCLIWKELDRQRRFRYKMKKKEEESKNNTIEPRAGYEIEEDVREGKGGGFLIYGQTETPSRLDGKSSNLYELRVVSHLVPLF